MARVLVVDDSGLSRRILRGILESGGHEVAEAADGLAALEAYALGPPDLVLLDLMMAGIDGLDVLARLIGMDPGARVVIATADIQEMTRAQVVAGGACGLINKPFEQARVLAAVDAALAARTGVRGTS